MSTCRAQCAVNDLQGPLWFLYLQGSLWFLYLRVWSAAVWSHPQPRPRADPPHTH